MSRSWTAIFVSLYVCIVVGLYRYSTLASILKTKVLLFLTAGNLMELIKELFYALWQQDLQMLANSSLIWAIYAMLFVIIFLENGLLPASFLPGDSLLLLSGALAATGTLHFFVSLLVLTAAAGLGCWVSYLQGRWLGNTRTVQRWMSHLPGHYHQRVQYLFTHHGLAALVIARFLAFIRTLLPTIAGLSSLNPIRFQIFNWLSALLWVGSISGLGYGFSLTPFFKHHERGVMMTLFILPMILLVFGLLGSLIVVWRKKKKSNDSQ